jgi:hypothetical protein
VPDSTGEQTAPFTLEHTGGFAAQGVLDDRPYSAERLHPDEWPEPDNATHARVPSAFGDSLLDDGAQPSDDDAAAPPSDDDATAKPSNPTAPPSDPATANSSDDLERARARLDERANPEPVVPHPAPVVIPGIPQFVGRGRFLVVLVGTWLLAGAAGAGLYWWWFHSADKAMAVFAVLVVTVGCIVGSLLTSLVQNKPSVSALALALMSAPLACAAGAALLYGGYVFGWVSP